MHFFNLICNCIKFAVYGCVDNVWFITPNICAVWWYTYNIKFVDAIEFCFFSFCSTCHTTKFFVKTEIVLESNCCKCFVFVLDFYAFFGFDCLVKAFTKAPAHHKTTSKFINNQNFIIFYDIVFITFHNVVCLKGVHDVVVKFCAFNVCKVVNAEKSFCLVCTFFG